MANHKSAEKRNRQNQKRRLINRQNLQRLRTQLKKMTTALSSKDVETVKAQLPTTLSLIDKSIQKGVIHKGAAARRKSRLMQKVNSLLTVPSVS